MLQQLGKGEVIGPFLMGIKRSANVLQRTTTVDGIINSVALVALEAQYLKERKIQKEAEAQKDASSTGRSAGNQLQ
jgi:preprotein translocase subunit SecG